MSNQKNEKSKGKVPRAPILGGLFSKKEKDEEYIPELRAQWENMNGQERMKFILGGLVGLILFLGALILLYLVINAMAH